MNPDDIRKEIRDLRKELDFAIQETKYQQRTDIEEVRKVSDHNAINLMQGVVIAISALADLNERLERLETIMAGFGPVAPTDKPHA